MNQVILIGHAGSDPQIKTFENGRKVATFTMATTEKYNDQEKTTWHNIVCWGYLTERPVKKGSKIFLMGKLDTRSYEKDGQTYYRTEVVALFLEIVQKLSKVNPVESFVSDDDPFYKKNVDKDGFTTPVTTQTSMHLGTGSQGGKDDDLPF